MGITLYYRGLLKTPELIHDLISEACDIAQANHWRYQIFDDPWDNPVTLEVVYEDDEPTFEGNAGLKGIVLYPHSETDGLALLFDHAGSLRSLEEMTYPAAQRRGVAYISTQSAGLDVHIRIVGLLEYLGNKYAEEWIIDDDSGYHSTRDSKKAEQVFHAVDDAIRAVTEAFDSIEIPEDLAGSEESFFSMVEARIKAFLPGVEIHRVDEDGAWNDEEE